MNELDDVLDLPYHRSLNPEVYYRCPTLESLEGALQNELHKSTTGLIPIEIVTEFVFAVASTITIPVTQQGNLDSLGLIPAEGPQTITVDHALCRNIEGKDRLKAQRAVARSVIEVIQAIDGFKYCERHASNKNGTAGTRFKYVCADSLQNRDRKANAKKAKAGEENGVEELTGKPNGQERPTYDCGGAIHIKFSTKREAVNIVYKHNPIHRNPGSGTVNEQVEKGQNPPLRDVTNGARDTADGTTPKKRKRRTNKEMEEDKAAKETSSNGYYPAQHRTPVLSEASTTPAKKKRQKNTVVSTPSPAKNKKKLQKV